MVKIKCAKEGCDREADPDITKLSPRGDICYCRKHNRELTHQYEVGLKKSNRFKRLKKALLIFIGLTAISSIIAISTVYTLAYLKAPKPGDKCCAMTVYKLTNDYLWSKCIQPGTLNEKLECE